MIITNSMWEAIKNEIPVKQTKVGRPEMDPRKALNAIYFVIRTGCQWHMLPKSLGIASTIHGKFMRWLRMGVFEKIHQLASKLYLGKLGKWGIWYATDTISVKAPLATEQVGKNPTDRSKKGTKRSMIVDRNGAPLGITIHAANVHDSQVVQFTFKALLNRYEPSNLNIIAADSAYDSKKIRTFFNEQNFILLASENKRRKVVDKIYKPLHRWIVERTHGWLNQNRGVNIHLTKL